MVIDFLTYCKPCKGLNLHCDFRFPNKIGWSKKEVGIVEL